jgi:MoxR-like ATPase
MVEPTWRDAIIRVLRDSDTPMHPAEIAQAAIANGYFEPEGESPDRTVSRELSESVRTDATSSPFIRVDRGVYTLRDTNSALAQQQVEQSDEAQEVVREQKVWIFQANPKRYDLLDFLARPSTQPGIVDEWALRQHATNVSDGDTVLLWTAGDQAGIYATGTVVGQSFMRPRQDWEPEDAPPESLTIHFRLDRILDHPVLRRDLVNHPVLKDLSVIRQPQGTNFLVTEQQWGALRPLIEPLNPNAAYFILNQREIQPNGRNEYNDVEGVEYHWTSNSSGAWKQLSNSPGAEFVYYRPGKASDSTSMSFFGSGRISKVHEPNPGEFVATIEDFARFEHPVPSSDGPNVNHQTSIHPITKGDFDNLLRLGVAEAEHGELTLELIRDAAANVNLKLDDAIYSQLLAALASEKHVILTGPPGTAKTTLAQVIAEVAQRAGLCTGFMPTTATADWTTYETIGGLQPRGTDKLEFEEGHFLQAIRKNQWLLIDELNRSQFDRAFGQLFTVLSGQPVVLPYSRPGTNGKPLVLLPPRAQSPIPDGDVLHIPASWRIIATMNVFDKSLLFEMSFALMRRFAFIEVASPAPAIFGELIDQAAAGEPKAASLAKQLLVLRDIKDLGPAVFIDLTKYLRERISLQQAEDGQLMFEAFYSYLLPQFEGIDAPTGDELYKTVSRLMDSAARRNRLRQTLNSVLGLELVSTPGKQPVQDDQDDTFELPEP